MHDPSSSIWLAGLEDAARTALPAEVYRYVSQGAREGLAAAEATGSWRRYRMTPRIFGDVRTVDLTTDLLGFTASAPLGVAPTTLQRAAHPDGELAMAAACRDAGVPLVLSSNAGTAFADVGATGVHWWLQAYLTEDRSLSDPVLRAAVEAGARAIVLTADTPVVATKYDGGAIWSSQEARQVRLNLGEAADAPKARNLSPYDVTRVAALTGLPVIVKGVLHPDDALAAVIAGAAAVWVSNHGGRQLERAVATADVLGAIADRIEGRAPVYVDGGVRSGSDVLTALALGADAVFLGRLPLYALAGDGPEGVVRLVETLAEELAEGLRLSGADGPDTLRTRGPKPQFGP